MERFLFALLLMTFAALYLSSVANGLQPPTGLNTDIESINVTEGKNLTETCNLTGSTIIWNTPIGQLFGKQLNLTNITRKFTGLYSCSSLPLNYTGTEHRDTRVENSQESRNSFFLDVLYPPKIKFVKAFKTILQPHDTYEINVGIEGNPIPLTTFISLSDGKTWYNQTEEGNHTIKITDVNCTDAGNYQLTCENNLGTDSKEEVISVTCVPDPVTGLYVTSITTSNARINFVTGNDFSSRQSFYVMRIIDGKLIDFHMNNTDISNDKGGMPFFVTTTNLTPTTEYNFTVIPGNRWGNSSFTSDFVSFYTDGKPEPDPDFPLNQTFKPRLGESVSLNIHARGNPIPSYKWFHNGTLLNSTDNNYTSILDLPDINVDNFGPYYLDMTNEYGTYSVDYELLPDGPPEPVSSLSVSNINSTCAHIHFVTGYNYNSTQIFIISVYENGHHKVTLNCKDLTSGNGGDPFICELCSLKEDALYSITIVANNSRGESEHNPDSVTFSTDGKPEPDPDFPVNKTFKPRLGESVSLIIHARCNPIPSYKWFHNGKELNSTDNNYTSILDLPDIKVDNFGPYNLNMTNHYGTYSVDYELLPDGPPAPVTNLNISTVTVSSANISFTTGYDYNKTQTFIVMRYLNGKNTELTSVNDIHRDPGQRRFNILVTKLTSNTEYNITIAARNSNGTSPTSHDFKSFMTEGIPEPDPAIPENKTRAPRLGKNASFHIHAIGNPPPVFSWWYKSLPINHTDHGLDTAIEIDNVTEDDFGDYILNMKNTIGSKNYTFTIKPDGPPDPVTKLSCSDISDDSIELNWKAGFDYGSAQTFQVQGVVNNKPLQNMKDLKDTTGGKGGQVQSKLEHLEGSSTYVLYLVATNARGKALKSNEVSFSTQAASSKGDGTTTAEYVGYIVGGVGAFVFVIAILYVVWRRYCKRTSETRYRNLTEEQDEERTQPHVYRYDDAASSLT